MQELYAAGLPADLPGGLASLALSHREELMARVAAQQANVAALRRARDQAAGGCVPSHARSIRSPCSPRRACRFAPRVRRASGRARHPSSAEHRLSRSCVPDTRRVPDTCRFRRASSERRSDVKRHPLGTIENGRFARLLAARLGRAHGRRACVPRREHRDTRRSLSGARRSDGTRAVRRRSLSPPTRPLSQL